MVAESAVILALAPNHSRDADGQAGAERAIYGCAYERDEPTDRPRVERKLITNLPVPTAQDAAEKRDWYALRWKFEFFQRS